MKVSRIWLGLLVATIITVAIVGSITHSIEWWTTAVCGVAAAVLIAKEVHDETN